MEGKRNRPGRLPEYDYSAPGGYFITFCTKNRECILSCIVGRDDLGAPDLTLTEIGSVVDGYIRSIPAAYPVVTLHKYVVMPNHVHLLLSIDGWGHGAPGSSRPTQLIPRIIAVVKRLSNRAAGCDLWQTTFYDHVLRGEPDYLRVWQYMDANPAKWRDDEYYTET